MLINLAQLLEASKAEHTPIPLFEIKKRKMTLLLDADSVFTYLFAGISLLAGQRGIA